MSEVFDHVGITVEGNIVQQSHSVSHPSNPHFHTIDEPIRDTVLRDFRTIGIKLSHVLLPKEESSILKDWDLWGPLLLCTLMAMLLQTSSLPTKYESGPEFAEVFIVIWGGSFIVTLNSKLLGGHISLFQSICVLGYCLLPLALALVACKFVLIVQQTPSLFLVRFLITFVGFTWAVYAAVMFLGRTQMPGRKGLVMYPIFLFYFIIAWLIISHSNQ